MIFADTSFWVALRNRRDPNHSVAAGLLDHHGGNPIVITNHVRGETWTFLRRRAGHRSAVDFFDSVDRSPRIQLVHVSEQMEEDASRWLRERADREYSFVDATSFVTMRSLRIWSVLAFDGDFSAAGFTELR